MRNLFNFLYRFRIFGLFLLLEGICAWLIINYNQQHNAAFLNSSNVLAAGISNASENTINYFRLKQINAQLLQENMELQEQMTLHRITYAEPDSLSQSYYHTIQAKVINNTYQRSMNYLTLNAGAADGVRPGMGVISRSGIIGQIKSVSRNFSTVTSVLHRNLMISSSLKRTNTLCTTQWDGISPLEAELRFIPRHIKIQVGDTIVTSGFNAVFPEGIAIGTISSFEIQDENVFYDARIALASDFTSLSYVFVIEHQLKAEKDSLENISFEFE